MKEIPFLKLFLVGMCTITFSIYGYFLVLSVLPHPQAIHAVTWVEAGVSDLRLREEPETVSNAIRNLPVGERLELVSEKDNWFEVRDSQGNQGWVYRPYVVYSPPGLQ